MTDARDTDFATHLRTAEDRLEAWGETLTRLAAEPILPGSDVEAMVTRPAATVATSVNLLTAIQERAA